MNIRIEHIKSVYFLGIGGIGMSALAMWFKKNGRQVNGYDRTASKITDKLQEEGIEVHFEDAPELIPADVDLVVYTPAIPSSLNEFIVVQQKRLPLMKRAQVLGLISNSYHLSAVAGTHGKTSVSTMLSWLLHQSSKGCNAFLGGLSNNFSSNLLINDNSKNMVVEADEFDRSFLQLTPDHAILTSVDADHLDIYGSKEEMHKTFREFVSQIRDGGHLLMPKSVQFDLGEQKHLKAVYTYSIHEEADFFIQNLEIVDGLYRFDIIGCNGLEIFGVTLGVAGLYNVENALGAAALASLIGATATEIRDALVSFKGIWRRFDTRIKRNDFVYIDDYAHHPTEIDACIKAIRHLYPDKQITAVFQPHLYSRTKDFASDFAAALDEIDQVLLLDIYPARELPIEGVTSSWLLELMKNKRAEVVSKSDLLTRLKRINPELLLTIGAGDIDRFVKEIEKEFA